MKKAFVAAALLACSALGFAGNEGGYAGGSFGLGNMDCDGCDIDTGFGMRLWGGYQFNEYIALEGGWGFVQAEESFQNGYLGDVTITYVQDVFDISGVASWPVADGFSLFGRLGLGFVTLGGTVEYGGQEYDAEDGDTETAAIYGIGANIAAGNGDIRIEYSSMGKETDQTVDASMLSIGYQFKF